MKTKEPKEKPKPTFDFVGYALTFDFLTKVEPLVLCSVLKDAWETVINKE